MSLGIQHQKMLLYPEIRASICLRKIVDYFKKGDDYYRNRKVTEFCTFAKRSGIPDYDPFFQDVKALGNDNPQFNEFVNRHTPLLINNHLLCNTIITYYELYIRD